MTKLAIFRMFCSSDNKSSKGVMERQPQCLFPLKYYISAGASTEPRAHLIAVGGGYNLNFGPTYWIKFVGGSRVISVICQRLKLDF